MIKSFETQLAFETWLGDNTLPSKTIAYVAESKEYFIHTNNMGEDEVIHGTYAELKSLSSVPKDILQEIEVFDNNLNPAPPQPGLDDLEGRVEHLETANTQTNQKVDAIETTVTGNTAAIVNHSTSIEGLQESTFTLESDVSGLKTNTSELEQKIANITLPDGSLKIDPSIFKTVAGQEIVGEGDITVGVDENLVRQIANSVCDERIGDVQTAVSYILGDIDAQLGSVLGDE